MKPRRALAAEKDRVIVEDPNEIPNSESVDKLTIQLCLVALAYAGAYGIMLLLAAVPKRLWATWPGGLTSCGRSWPRSL